MTSSMQNSGQAIKLDTIAAKAGVSRSTVSRVINQDPHVREKTRQHVLSIIEAEGYTPNPAARMLVTQRTEVIGVVIPHIPGVVFDNPHYFPSLLNGVAQATNARGYAMMLWMQDSVTDEDYFYKRILANRLMDGLIVASSTVKSHFTDRLDTSGIQYVTVERAIKPNSDAKFVTIDNIAAAETAVNHLISLGRRNIATITGDLDNPDGEDRLKGYQAALSQAGLPYRPELVKHGMFTQRSGFEGVQQLLSEEFDAIFAANDPMAIGALEALRKAGLRVPEDVALVGFDDLPSAAQSTPALTTINQPLQEKGELATHLLLDLIEGKKDRDWQILLPTQLIIRESCGAMIEAS